MDELVKKADVIDCLRLGKDESIEISRRGIKEYILGVCRKIKQLQTIQPEVEKKGKWNWDFADNGWADWTCSICGWGKNTDIHVNLGYNFCPNCGADMRGEDNE